MDDKYQVEKISYDLINNAYNIDHRERSILFGNSNKFVAARPTRRGLEVLMHTIGRRDDCKRHLHQYLQVYADQRF